jgi:hypothetical protein
VAKRLEAKRVVLICWGKKATVLPVESIAIVPEVLTGIALGTWPARAAERINKREQYTIWLLHGLAGFGWHF